MNRRTIAPLVVGALAVACAAGAFANKPAPASVVESEVIPEGSEWPVLAGVVQDKASGDRLKGALVVIQCDCMQDSRETATDAEGIYKFHDLPSGEYRILLVYKTDGARRDIVIRPGVLTRVNFRIDLDPDSITIT